MIQRKQSVYLLLGAVSIAVVFLLDGAFEPLTAEALSWYVPALVATGAVTVIIAVVAIFLYENRPLQKKVVVGVQVLDLAFLMLLVGGMLTTGTLEFSAAGPSGLERMLVLLLPVAAYVLFYLARRGIQADIDLVRSMDRLR